jgi:hypothetical protein
MRLGFSFFGIIHGAGGRTGSDRDFRHCWPGLKRDLIDPFIDLGHTAKIYFSGYPIHDTSIEKEFYDLVKPDRVNYSHFANSDPFTAKFAAFNNFMDDDIDVVIFTRSDIHFSRIMADEDIDFFKFNFLFPELGWWETHHFTCDNFYVVPKYYFKAFRDAMEETYAWPRGKPYVDTHGLWLKLCRYIPTENFHFISKVPEISDINSFYTCCRSGLPEGEDRMKHLHSDVKERFYK